jgi:hypothetical protein|tara:strand:- start:4700 stop:5470 length:771 start_codon:yes stop_codon:yes gene_type:complete
MSHGALAWRVCVVRAVSSATATTSVSAGVGRRGVKLCGRVVGGSNRRIAASSSVDEERVTSTDNATVKHFAKLVKSRTCRDEFGSVVVCGAGLLAEIYATGAGGVPDAKVVFLGDDAAGLPNGMRALRVVRAPAHVLRKASGLLNTDTVDVVAELATPPIEGIGAWGSVALTATRILALDGIQDPGNLGTLTRTALALGWDAVALLPGTCDPFNDKVGAGSIPAVCVFSLAPICSSLNPSVYSARRQSPRPVSEAF